MKQQSTAALGCVVAPHAFSNKLLERRCRRGSGEEEGLDERRTSKAKAMAGHRPDLHPRRSVTVAAAGRGGRGNGAGPGLDRESDTSAKVAGCYKYPLV